MVYRVVSANLAKEEHFKLIGFCNGKGCAPFALLQEAINQMMNGEKAK